MQKKLQNLQSFWLFLLLIPFIYKHVCFIGRNPHIAFALIVTGIIVALVLFQYCNIRKLPMSGFTRKTTLLLPLLCLLPLLDQLLASTLLQIHHNLKVIDIVAFYDNTLLVAFALGAIWLYCDAKDEGVIVSGFFKIILVLAFLSIIVVDLGVFKESHSTYPSLSLSVCYFLIKLIVSVMPFLYYIKKIRKPKVSPFAIYKFIFIWILYCIIIEVGGFCISLFMLSVGILLFYLPLLHIIFIRLLYVECMGTDQDKIKKLTNSNTPPIKLIILCCLVGIPFVLSPKDSMILLGSLLFV